MRNAVLRAGVGSALAGVLALGVSACGGSKKETPPPVDPVAMALQAPGVRTVVIPKQSNDLTILVPPCTTAEVKQETTKPPPGSNRVVVPRSALDQTVAIQPCVKGVQTSGRSSTVLLSPGGAGSPQTPGQQQQGQPQNQLLLPKKSNLATIIVPPCIVETSSAGTTAGPTAGGTNIALPAIGTKTSVTAPPCRVHMTTTGGG